MSEPPSTRSKLGRVVRSVLRVALLVVATVTVMVVGVLALKWKEIKQAGAPTPKSNVLMLQAAVLQLWADGFTGCPDVQQVLELNQEPLKSDQDPVLVFSLGPDKQAGTADDITSVL